MKPLRCKGCRALRFDDKKKPFCTNKEIVKEHIEGCFIDTNQPAVSIEHALKSHGRFCPKATVITEITGKDLVERKKRDNLLELLFGNHEDLMLPEAVPEGQTPKMKEIEKGQLDSISKLFETRAIEDISYSGMSQKQWVQYIAMLNKRTGFGIWVEKHDSLGRINGAKKIIYVRENN